MEQWPIKIHSLANVELKEAVAWYGKVNQSLSDDFCAAIDIAFDRISRSPRQGTLYIDDFRQILLDRFPYSVIYRPREAEVQIMAIAHHKRRPGYWRSRE